MRTFIIISSFLLILGCNTTSQNSGSLNKREKQLCDSLGLDISIVNELRNNTKAGFEPFHYSLSTMYKDGIETELDPIHLKGLVFKESQENTELLLDKLRKDFLTKGYSLFILDRNFGINNKLDVMAVLKTSDKYEVLKQIKTDGINFDIDNDSLIKIVHSFDKECGLELIGASGDWCEFTITREPCDWMKFSEMAYKYCPDIVDQGTGTVEALSAEMKRTKRLYFWWD
jgi:hypothetical protein